MQSTEGKHSPPPTPSSEPPSYGQGRFPEDGSPCEWIEDYRPTGFHPVQFGDEFKDGRYRVIRKLGYGSFSTVWLAVDRKLSHFVALKIMSAKASMNSQTELAICNLLTDRATRDPMGNHIMLLLDSFRHTGPNGEHTCMVTEPMGSSAESLREELPENQPPMLGKTPRYPTAMAKRILKDALNGLAFLHKNGIVHGDVQPGNMLFAIRDLTSIGEDKLGQDRSKMSRPQRRLDGKEDRWAPPYLALGQSLHEFVERGSKMTVKVSDFGAAFWEQEPPESTVTPIALRAPESIFSEGPYNSSIDIWAFGCLIYEFLTATPLFSVFCIGNDEREDADDDHILDLIDVLGSFPERLMAKWSRKHKYIGPEGERLPPPKRGEGIEVPSDEEESDSRDESEPDAERSSMEEPEDSPINDPEAAEDIGIQDPPFDPNEPIMNEPLDVQFEKNKAEDIDAKEAEQITALIRQILKYDPAERPTAAQLLEHPWFREIA